jgi:hypothetical protein
VTAEFRPAVNGDVSAATPVDLDDDTRRALEFDELLEWVASFARTAPGRRRLREKHPSCDAGQVTHELQQVAQMRALLARDGKLLPGDRRSETRCPRTTRSRRYRGKHE